MIEVNERLTLREMEQILYNGETIRISEKLRSQVVASYEFLKEFSKDKVIYGINTGFGPMAQWRIEDEHLKELQYNIIRSHSTGAGERLPDICVRAAMLSRLKTFLEGHSGVHVTLIDLLIEFVNRGICPVVPRHGSVGASGNLGTIIRIADWFGIEDIICSKDTVDVYNPKVVQATMGSIARVRVVYTSLPHLVDSLPKDHPVFGTLLDGENIYTKDLPQHGIIVMGNEGNGISAEMRSRISQKLLIPTFATTADKADSLNVAVATAIVCSEFRR